MNEDQCPICHEIYSTNDTPVILMDDLETYGLTCLNKWIAQKSTSPLHNSELKSRHMIPNLQLIKRLNLGGLTGMGSVVLPPNSILVAETEKGSFYRQNGEDEIRYLVSASFVYNNVFFNRGNRNDYLDEVIKNYPITFPSIINFIKCKYVEDLIQILNLPDETLFYILKKYPLYFHYLTDEQKSNIELIKIAAKSHTFILTMVPHPENIPIKILVEIELSITDNWNSVLRFIPQNEALCLAIVRHRPISLLFVENQTEEMCVVAIKKDIQAFNYSTIRNNATLFRTRSRPYFSLDKCFTYKKIIIPLSEKINIVTECPDAIKNIEYQTPETNMIAIKKNPELISFIIQQTEELCLEVVTQNPSLLQFCHIHTPKVLYKAWSLDKGVIRFFI